MSVTVQSRVISHRSTRWVTATGIVLGVYALLFVFLVVAIYGEDKTINIPLAILASAGLILSSAILVTRRGALCRLAAVLATIDLLADAPFQISAIVHPTHPNDPGRIVVGGIIILVGIAAVAVATLAATKERHP